MPSKIKILILSLSGLAAGGCQQQSKYNAPPPRRAEVTQERIYGQPSYSKPLPGPSHESQVPAPPFADAPLVSQRLPEEQQFVNAYNAVGRPRVVLFVNRTLEGDLVPVNPDLPLATVERRAQASTGVNIETHNSDSRGYYDRRDQSARLQTTGPGEFKETTSVYLHPGQYDEVSAKSLDYEALENILTDWMSADGRVAIISPQLARQRLTDEQVRDLQSGRPRVAREAAQQLDAPILIHVQAHPTRQTPQGLEVRVIAEVIDVQHNGGSLARAVVDIPPPLEKTQLNYYTRFLARKLMDGMTASWQSFGAPPAQLPQGNPPALNLPPANPSPLNLPPAVNSPPALNAPPAGNSTPSNPGAYAPGLIQPPTFAPAANTSPANNPAPATDTTAKPPVSDSIPAAPTGGSNSAVSTPANTVSDRGATAIPESRPATSTDTSTTAAPATQPAGQN